MKPKFKVGQHVLTADNGIGTVICIDTMEQYHKLTTVYLIQFDNSLTTYCPEDILRLPIVNILKKIQNKIEEKELVKS